MAETVQLKAFGRVDLDGTHRAVIEADRPAFEPGADGHDSTPRFIKLTHNGRSCGCLVSEVRRGAEGRIHLDRLKLWHLGLRDGDTVSVEPFEPAGAGRAVLRVPSDFSKTDVVRFVGKPLVRGEKTALFTFGGETRPVEVTDTSPDGVVVLTPSSEIRTTSARPDDVPVSWDDIGGLEREIRTVREVVEVPFRFPELFKHLGVSPPRGIILYGPPGTGKTLIARALANESGARFYSISGPEIYSKWYGRSEENLRNIFSEAVRNAPSIVVIDELDALVPIREKAHGDQEQRIVATFLTQMDGLKEMKDVVVVGTTNRIDAIDPALRRGGRFECEVCVGVPDEQGRKQILSIHTRRMPLDDDVDLDLAAGESAGYVGADIASLCREAALNALRRTFPLAALEAGEPAGIERIRVTREDFDRALRSVPPSALKEVLVEIPRARWEDVGGLEETKRLLVENISRAVTCREAFRAAGVRPASGILLHGPPGTGKTLLARAVASECSIHFIVVRGPEIRSRWIGEAEERIRFLFSKARMVAPCVVFLDEIDAALPRRGRDASGSVDSVVNQILAQMDGIEGGEDVFVIGATNRIEMLDPAALRPGRFDCLVEVGLPSSDARADIFGIHLRGKPLALDVDVARLAESSEGMSGAEIAETCRAASWSALRDAGFDVQKFIVGMTHLTGALERVRTSLAGLQIPVRGLAQEGKG